MSSDLNVLLSNDILPNFFHNSYDLLKSLINQLEIKLSINSRSSMNKRKDTDSF